MKYFVSADIHGFYTYWQEALNEKASDIHIEPMEDKVRVRFRVDGVLKEHATIDAKNYQSLISRYKIMSRLDIAERRVPQDGKINFNYNGIEYDFRVSTLPIQYGEKIVIRLYNSLDSGESLEYLDPNTNQKIIPYVIEPSAGLDRLMLTCLVDSYDEETLPNGETRVVMHLDKKVAPIKAAILPLSKQLSEKANEVFEKLISQLYVVYDDTGSIGKRYRRQDAIGTPYCITIDFDTINDNSVTIRERDSMSQIRIPIEKIYEYIK